MIQETLDGIVIVLHMDSLFAYEDLNMSKPHSLVRTVIFFNERTCNNRLHQFGEDQFYQIPEFLLINLMWLIRQCKMNYIRDKVI